MDQALAGVHGVAQDERPSRPEHVSDAPQRDRLPHVREMVQCVPRVDDVRRLAHVLTAVGGINEDGRVAPVFGFFLAQ